METTLRTSDLVRLIRNIFQPRPEDRKLALLVDLPDEQCPDHPDWETRRRLAGEWRRSLEEGMEEIGLDAVSLILYRNARRNNADLPDTAALHAEGPLPASAREIEGRERPLAELLAEHQILIAVTELSATAPLKIAAPKYGFRAATMPGFHPGMIPALRLDYEEIHRRCVELKKLLDRAAAASIRFRAEGREHALELDLRFRAATASGGLVREPGTAGNLPSGETYIVPYEGEREGERSRTQGLLPLELDGELLYYRIEANRVVEVRGDGPVAAAERREMEAEPAYGNVAELGLGLLSDYGIRPVGSLLLDEKLGLHIAFGRSDHFGGRVGAADFSSPEKVVHIDRVYIPEVQPAVEVLSVDLEPEPGAEASPVPLMRNGRYV